jgi:RNA-directed DNA polymerase
MSAVATLAGAAPNTAADWHSIHWKKVQRTVRRLQARIVKAVREGKWHKVRALVYLLTHSFSGRALAILRVVSNSGAKTPGVDGVLWDTPGAKSIAFSALRRHGYRPQPPWHVHHLQWRCYGGSDTFDNLELLHDHCHRQIHGRKRD